MTVLSAKKSSRPFRDSYPGIRRAPTLYVVPARQVKKRVSRKLLAVVVSVIALTSSLLTLSGVRVAQWKSAYAIAKLETKAGELQRQKRLLQLEQEVLSRPDRIHHLAKTKLGLSKASAEQMVRMKSWNSR